jgi:hypothetical protein
LEATGAGEQTSWYEAVDQDKPLEQGDILRACPVPVITSILPLTEAAAQSAEVAYDFDVLDLIILSQSCDITMQGGRPRRVDDIVVCPAWELPRLREDYPEIDRGSFIADIIRGRIPLWHALAPSEISGLERSHTFLEFRRIVVLPAAHLDALAIMQSRRLRLRSPWREHMSYAAGALLGRPAIPEPAPTPPKPTAHPTR